MVDVKDKDGFTVLQAAVKAAWVAGVCIALEAGADVTIRVIYKTKPYNIARNESICRYLIRLISGK